MKKSVLPVQPTCLSHTPHSPKSSHPAHFPGRTPSVLIDMPTCLTWPARSARLPIHPACSPMMLYSPPDPLVHSLARLAWLALSTTSPFSSGRSLAQYAHPAHLPSSNHTPNSPTSNMKPLNTPSIY